MKEKLTRREFLIAAGIVGINMAGGFACRSQENSEELKPITLEEQIEKKYKIDLIGVGDFKNSDDLPNDMIPGVSPNKWDEERIVMLDQHLDLLPAHLYQPKKKLRIGLGEESTQQNDHLITLEHTSQYNPSNFRRSFLVLVHELTHVRSCTQGGADDCFGSTADNNSYYQDVDEALGEKYETKQESIYQQLINSYRNMNAQYAKLGMTWGELQYSNRIPLVEQQRAQFYEIMLKGISWENPTHFITSLAEHYVHGKDFFDHYSEFFSQDQTNQLYEYTKDKIFKGTEYQYDWYTGEFTSVDGD